jgi:hypothetical protein
MVVGRLQYLPDCPDVPEPSGGRTVDVHRKLTSGTVMKTLLGLRRKDVIRVVALLSVVTFPLIADAQFGPVTRAVKPLNEASSAASAIPEASAAVQDSCAAQHWPFFSEGCLRGSTETIKPRLVSMNAESTSNSAPATQAAKAVAIDIAHGLAPLAKAKKPAKPRTATRARRIPDVSYALNSGAGNMFSAGW